MNAPVEMTEPPMVVSITSTAPADLAGVVTVTEVDVLLVIDEPVVPPNEIVNALLRFVPEIVTEVPPDVVPVVVDSEEIVGTRGYADALVAVLTFVKVLPIEEVSVIKASCLAFSRTIVFETFVTPTGGTKLLV